MENARMPEARPSCWDGWGWLAGAHRRSTLACQRMSGRLRRLTREPLVKSGCTKSLICWPHLRTICGGLAAQIMVIAINGMPLHQVPIRYESDGLMITGLLSKPAGDGPFPLVLVNHGGFDPAKSVSRFLDAFASHGFVALASDYRGCGGSEGKHEAVKGEVNDVLAALRYAKTLPYVDPSRAAVWGFSHGGVVALFAASREPAIRAVVNVQGPVEMADCWRHWMESPTSPGLKPLLGLSAVIGGTPDQVPAAWRDRSALYVAHQVRCPVLLIYSAAGADEAVPTDQGRRMESALRAAGNRHVTLRLVPHAGHGLNSKVWAELLPEMLEFLKSWTRLPGDR